MFIISEETLRWIGRRGRVSKGEMGGNDGSGNRGGNMREQALSCRMQLCRSTELVMIDGAIARGRHDEEVLAFAD